MGTPITPKYSVPLEPKTFHQRTLDASQTIRNRPGTFKECRSPYVSMRALIEVGDILSIRCDTLFLINSWASNGNLYCKFIIAAVSEILRRVFISTIRQTQRIDLLCSFCSTPLHVAAVHFSHYQVGH